jgi:hypothetical protein
MTEYTQRKGHIGNALTGGRRLGVPDWVRASAEDADTTVTGDVADSDVVSDILGAEADATSDIPKSFNLSIAQGIDADADGTGDIPTTETIHSATSDEAVTTADVPIVETIHDADSGEAQADSDASVPRVRILTDSIESAAETDGSVSDQRVVVNAGDSHAETDAGIPVIGTVHDGTDADATATGSKTIVTWQAGLGGVVKDPSGSPVNGAEVHVIRDNDDTKVATTETSTINGADGRWHVTVRGGKTTEADPPIYSIEVWYREGPKRDPSATLFNSTNRPFIDTADASETSPNDEFYYNRDA